MTTTTRRGALPGATAAAVMAGRKARAGTPVRLGVLADMSDPSVIHDLKAVMDMGPDAVNADGWAAAARMKQIPIDDPIFGQGRIRQGGRKIHDMFLFRVKASAGSHDPRDDYRQLADTPVEQAFRPEPEGHCVIVKA